jgi:predicted phosphate transport protein (TIGR00153 family)
VDEVSFLDLFAHSPIKPMQEHMHVVRDCVREVVPLFEAACRDEAEAIRERQERIDDLEGQADRLKNDLRAHLPKRLLMPVDRRDLLEILDLQDSIADIAQDIAELLVERPMPVPESMREPLLELCRGVERTCEKSAEVIDRLDELVELGFRGREADKVEAMIDQVGTLEGETDRLGMALTRELFRLEGTLPPVTVMLWYHLIDWIGNLADNAEKVGNRLRLMIAR